jgi:hypothetical protein
MRIDSRHWIAAVALIFAGAQIMAAQSAPQTQTAPDSLKSGFEMPPAAAHPRVWWHWMNGNITKEGIKLDLDWMHSVGIGGFATIDASLATPQVVKQRIIYMTPEWNADFLYATQLAEQFGMKESIDSSPGWSETGGPWVQPSQGMKKYVWSQTIVEGGQRFDGKLAYPPTSTGAFQDETIHDSLGSAPGSRPIPQYYADSIVTAYRLPKTDVSIASLHPIMSSSGGNPDYSMLTDGDLLKATSIPIPPAGSDAWIQYAFPHPVTIRAISLVTHDPSGIVAMVFGIAAPQKTLEASNDGSTWHTVTTLDTADSPETTVSFPGATAKYFRVTFHRGTPPAPPAWAKGIDPKSFGINMAAAPKGYEIAELVLHPGARVNHFEEKAAFVPTIDLYRFSTPDVAADSVVKESDVIDLTSKMRPDGTLDWTPPPGRWAILRFGYSLLGITNHPATVESTGLEVDKLNGRDVHQYMETFLDSYKSAVGASNMGEHGVTSVTNDSWEAGSQNWTDDMVQQFRRLRGYDPTPWMPVLTGVIIGSPAQSDRFLWDFRETIGDLIASEHFGVIQNVLDQWHLRHYCESHESGRALVADGMEVKKDCQVPMGAMWTASPGENPVQYGYNADDRESASVAHIYGQNMAAAESMTAAAAPWAWSPAALKPTADQEFLNGINRFFIHESAHQPLIDKKPGLTLGPFGQWFNRNETWASEAGPWVSYLARNSYLLQQGRFAADIIYFYGEDTNLTAVYEKRSPNLPSGYDYDYVNADALIHVLSVNNNGAITTPGGVTYRILGLNQNSRHMSLPVLQAIHKLVMEGATVAGPKPTDDPSLADDQNEFHKIATELFGSGTGVQHVGKGLVYAGQTVAEALSAMHLSPDFNYTAPQSDANLKFIHRKISDGDLYFVDNRSDHVATVDASFRVAGRTPQLWYAETGTMKPVSFSIADDRTTIPLKLEPWGTVFVVFRKPTNQTSWTAPVQVEKQLATVDGSWKLSFPPDWGAPASITLDSLSFWNKNSNQGVKYFSGTGTYSKTINASASWFRHNAHVWIDLGDVKNLADVSVNGKSLGIIWHAPYRMDVTSALHPGANELSIKVTNAWVNRLIGDQQPNVARKFTFTDYHPYKADSPLLPSDLLGPVTFDSVLTQ